MYIHSMLFLIGKTNRIIPTSLPYMYLQHIFRWFAFHWLETSTLYFHYRAPGGEEGQVAYDQLVQHLNWRDHPVPPMQYQPVKQDEEWAGNKPTNVINQINYNPLLDDLLGKKASD